METAVQSVVRAGEEYRDLLAFIFRAGPILLAYIIPCYEYTAQT